MRKILLAPALLLVAGHSYAGLICVGGTDVCSSAMASGVTSGTTTIASGADKSVCFDDGGVINCADTGMTYTKSSGEEILAATTDSALLRVGSLAGGLTFSPVLNSNTAVIGHGAERVSGAWTARNTSASLFGASVDSSQAFVVYANTGLTSGNTYSPSQAFIVTMAGNTGAGSTSPTSRFVVDGGAIVSSATGMHFAVDASGGEIQTFGSKTLRLNALGNNVVIGASVVPVSSAVGDLGSTTLPWANLWLTGAVKLNSVTQKFPKTFTATYDPASLAASTSRCDSVTVTGITTTGGAVTANAGGTAAPFANGCVVTNVRASGTDAVSICWWNTIAAATACDVVSDTWTFTQAQ